MHQILSPQDFFGHAPGTTGKLYNWPDMIRYFEHLAENSPRVSVRHMGLSSDGNPFIAVFVSDEEGISHLDKYRRISMQLSDPEGLTPEEIDALCTEGKSVCLQMSGQHAYELTPTQNSVALVHSLAVEEDPETLEILKNTILILIPTFNPDGLLDCYEWNEQVRGTKHNRLFSPHIYAKYSGHGNNRDNLYENIVETQYLNQLMYREWMPQVMADHHQAGEQAPTFFFGCAANDNQLAEGLSPLLVREAQLLTADVACSFQEKGFSDVNANCGGYGYGYDHVNNARSHNIVSILTEMTDTTFTAEGYISDDIRAMDRYPFKPTGLLPDPQMGRPWTPKEAIAYIHECERSLLLACARNKKRLLKGMASMAITQTQRGAQASVTAYAIPPIQHDRSAYHRLMQILTGQRIRYFRAQELIKAGNVLYPEGSLIVPCAQPKYALIRNIFEIYKPQESACGIYTNESEITTANVGLLLGIEVHEVKVPLEGKMEPVEEIPEFPSDISLPASENSTYKNINLLLKEGKKVFFDDKTNSYSTEEKGEELRKARIGLFRLSRFIYFRADHVSNDENPFTAMLLDRYGFDWRYIADKEIRNGIPQDIDILIIPGEWRTALEQGDKVLEDYPEEYTCGLGKVGAESIRQFVARGGRLIAWSSAASWAMSNLNLRIQDGKRPVEKGFSYWEQMEVKSRYGTKQQLTREDLCVCGPMLLAKVKQDRLTRGMPDSLPILGQDPGPIMRVTSLLEDYAFVKEYETLVRYVDADHLHVNGQVRGLRYLEHSACLVRTHIGAGEVILYSFDPKFRGQTESTFKLLFNALYL